MKKEFHLGFSILRSIMCFMVILIHCWDASNAQNVMKLIAWARAFSVPTFMMMSFLLVQPSLIEHDKKKMQNRFERLLIPQFGWAVIYWAVYGIIDLLLNKGWESKISDLLWQIFFGHKLNTAMWYQVDLIYLTLLFLVVIILCKKNYTSVLIILGMAALFIQYSGINMVFESLRYELSYPIGRFSEMLPIAVVGFVISSTNLLEKLKKFRIITTILAVFLIFMEYAFGFFSDVTGYGYSGIRMIVISFAFISLFYMIPFEKLPMKAHNMIKTLTSYTMGIYCMHRLVLSILSGIIEKLDWGKYFSLNTFSSAIFIYILCYMIALIGTFLFRKTKLKILFN